MPLKWEIFHDQKLVHIIAEGRVTVPEMEEHFDALAVADVLQYGKLFDATTADPVYSDEDVMALGARLSAYTATLNSGPLAVIGLSEQARSASFTASGPFRSASSGLTASSQARLFKASTMSGCRFTTLR